MSGTEAVETTSTTPLASPTRFAVNGVVDLDFESLNHDEPHPHPTHREVSKPGLAYLVDHADHACTSSAFMAVKIERSGHSSEPSNRHCWRDIGDSQLGSKLGNPKVHGRA